MSGASQPDLLTAKLNNRDSELTKPQRARACREQSTCGASGVTGKKIGGWTTPRCVEKSSNSASRRSLSSVPLEQSKKRLDASATTGSYTAFMDERVERPTRPAGMSNRRMRWIAVGWALLGLTGFLRVFIADSGWALTLAWITTLLGAGLAAMYWWLSTRTRAVGPS